MSIQYLPVSWQMYHNLAQKIARDILSDQLKLDEIVAIARGGLLVGLLLSDLIKIPISTITIQSYTDIKRQGKVAITAKLGRRICGKKILLVDDIADSGKTFLRSTSYIKTFHPTSITTAVIFYKPWSTYKPEYFALETDKWILQPHEMTEWITTFTKTMKSDGKSDTEIHQFLLSLGYTDEQIQFVRKYYPS